MIKLDLNFKYRFFKFPLSARNLPQTTKHNVLTSADLATQSINT